jgi:hypothetical protein
MKTSTRFATAVVCIMVFAIAATAQTAPTTTTATTGPSWYLVDADKSYNDPASRLRPLVDDDQLYLAELPAHVNVEYVPATTQKIGSLVTTDNGKRWQPSPVEGQKPWSVAGDDSHGKWVTLIVDPGIHQYAAKAFAGWNAGAVIETSTVRVNVALNRPAPETQPCSQPSTQPGVIGTVAQQPPPFPTISRIDLTTLAVPAWAGRTSFKGAPGTNYVVTRGLGRVFRRRRLRLRPQRRRADVRVHQRRPADQLHVIVARVHDPQRLGRARHAGGSARLRARRRHRSDVP